MSSDERRDIAENLRYAADYPGYEIRYMEQFVSELRETIFCDVCSDADYSEIFQRLTDLIDPTCELIDRSDIDGEPVVCSCCGKMLNRNIRWHYCPNCGARVVRPNGD